MTGRSEIPVLVTMFNRPDHAGRVLDALAPTRPRRLYLAVDGAREGRPEERERVEACRQLASRIDWPCEVRTRFREENLGCRRGMVDAVTWFFEAEEAGVVLEDDCVPHPSALDFFGEALSRYEDEARVFQVSGYAHIERILKGAYFIPLSNSWGWATWRNRWLEFLAEHESSAARILGDVELRTGFDLGGAFPYSRMLERSLRGEVSSWAVFFQAQLFARNGLVLHPPGRLVANIGFDDSGTHCRSGIREAEADLSKRSVSWRMPRHVVESRRLFEVVKQRIQPKRNQAATTIRRAAQPKRRAT